MARKAVDLAWREIGNGPPLVVLHGLFGSGTNWRAMAARLADLRRVLLVDLRNHGHSPHAAGMDYPRLADDVLALLERLGLAHADLLGHSMGGKTAMALALAHPGRVARLVVVDIAPGASPGDHEGLIAAMRGLDLTRIGRRADADAALARAVPDPALRAFLLQNLTASANGFSWRIDLEAIAHALPALLDFPDPGDAVYPGPTLFVRGARSPYVRDSDTARIGALFPSARLETVAGAGHWVHAEQPLALSALLRRFLSEPAAEGRRDGRTASGES